MAEEADRRVSISAAGEKAHPEREARFDRMIQTGKYDRKAMRARLGLENWIDDELTKLYGDVPYNEIDVEEILQEDEDSRSGLVMNLVAEAGNQELVPDFVKTLLEKLSQMVKEFGEDLSGKAKQRTPLPNTNG